MKAMTDITIIVEIVIGICGVLVSILLIPALVKRFGVDNLRKVAEIACNAAEEAARTGLLQKHEKYEYAARMIKSMLGVFSFTIDENKICAVINATCYELFNQFKDGGDTPES
jgi:hypothetical protein